ncbi:MAG: 3-hydroxyacyl-CoA dehydrogenase NAD-binding domain-containing protein [Pseudomonadota bacterium]
MAINTVDATVAVIEMDNPPVNGLGHALRSTIDAGVREANARDDVSAVVLVGKANVFSGGADIREFNTPAASAAPRLADVIDTIEASAKPVIAAIHGVAMGGGLELALACHYRLSTADAQIALPEVKLGILPGAGGTQRLPRVVGFDQAATMIITGAPVRARALSETALFDAVVEDDVRAHAVAFAAKIAGDGALPLVREREAPPVTHEGGLDAAVAAWEARIAKTMRGFPAPPACLDAVRAAFTQPFAEGMDVERQHFERLVASDASKAQRHAFFAERTCAKIPDIPRETATRAIAKVAVIGCGTMGGGIAMNFANAGIPVAVLETTQEPLDRGMAIIEGNYAASVKRGRLSQGEADKRAGLITPVLTYDAIADADLVIEAVFEEMDVKREVFTKLDAVMKPGAILATNTSTLDVDAIAAFTQRPQDVVGMHFFSPANVMRLLEIVRGKDAADDVVQTTMKLAKTIGKVGVLSGVCDGFIGNRMLEPYIRQSLMLVMEGARPQQVDAALQRWGMAMGPFRMYDLAGNDVGYRIRQRRYLERPALKPFYVLSDRICELERFGQKSGKGWYRYEPGDRTAHPDPDVDAIIDEVRAARGINPRPIDDEEIVERCVFALVNEGAQVLDEGIALRASDIDVVWMTGYGFPVYRGGPMFYADTRGLDAVVARMGAFADTASADADFWKPAPLLQRLADGQKRFNG